MSCGVRRTLPALLALFLCVATPTARAQATYIGTGTQHSCALLANGTVKCWGGNAFGQLGYGDTAQRGDNAGEMGSNLPAVSLGTGRTAKAVAVGSNHSCALLDNNTVKCWGNGNNGRLGYGDTSHRGDGAGEMGDALPTVDLGTGRTATSLMAGNQFMCALLDNGDLKCWGQNSNGQLGRGDTSDRGDAAGEMGDALPKVDLGTGRTAKAVYPGSSHACALLDNNTVKCWGSNGSGKLGYGDQTARGDAAGEMGDALPTVDLGTGRTAKKIAATNSHTCAILDNSSVKCWGSSSSGQLGYGDQTARGDAAGEMGDALPTVDLGTGRTAKAITQGTTHTCAVLDNNTLKCWGENGLGELGQGDTNDRGDAAGEMGDALPAISLGTGRTVVGMTSRQSHTCAVLDNSALKCWGYNATGQLGLGDTNNRGDAAGEMGDALLAVDLASTALPVELTAFTAAVSGPDVLLRWSTASETNNAGFSVELQGQNAGWQAAGFVAGHGTTLEAQAYAFRLPGLAPGTYTLRLRQTDTDGAVHLSPSVEVTVGLDAPARLTVLGPQVRFAVSQAQRVRVTLVDVMGRHVADVFAGDAGAGTSHVASLPVGLAAGVYVVRLQGPHAATSTTVVVR